MDPADVALRNRTYRRFVDLGRAPTAIEMAEAEGVSVETLLAGWRRLHDAHALVLDADATALRMANPFSSVPTPFRVSAGGRTWFANCAWDAFGIPAALRDDGKIETTCPDCREVLRVAVTAARPSRDDLVFHVLVPAARWWADIGYT